ncbi:MAG: hypothetical protein ACREOP_07060 [Thermodesulfobacteriota bacterium]
MSDEPAVTKTTGGSSIEITQNSKGDFQFAVKVYTGDLTPEPAQDVLMLAQETAIQLAKKCLADIKAKLNPQR